MTPNALRGMKIVYETHAANATDDTLNNAASTPNDSAIVAAAVTTTTTHRRALSLVNSSQTPNETKNTLEPQPITTTTSAQPETKNATLREYSDKAWELMQQQREKRVKVLDEYVCRAPREGEYGDNPPSSLNTTKPSVAFLFLSGGEQSRIFIEDIWKAWFPPRDDDRYTIWVHTKPNQTHVPVGPFFCPYTIPSVDSSYWWLHEAMMQLLSTAYQHSTATHFVFMSSATLPLQSFDQVYDELTRRDKSCMCLMKDRAVAHNLWSAIADTVGVSREHQYKAELWSALARDHAKVLVDNAPIMQSWNQALVDFRSSTGKKVGAPDEMFFATMLARHNRTREFSETHGAVETTNDRVENVPPSDPFAKMGCCTHHITWDIVRLVDDPSRHVLTRKCSRMLGAPPQHPCAYQHLLMEGIKTVQKDFMFLRKVWHGTTIETADGTDLTLMDGMVQLGILWNSTAPLSAPGP